MSAGVALGLFLAAWVFTSTAALLVLRSRSGAAQLARSSRSFCGMVLAHVGIGVFIVGVTMVRGYETERDVKRALGDHVEVGGYRFTFQGVQEHTGTATSRSTGRPSRPRRYCCGGAPRCCSWHWLRGRGLARQNQKAETPPMDEDAAARAAALLHPD